MVMVLKFLLTGPSQKLIPHSGIPSSPFATCNPALLTWFSKFPHPTQVLLWFVTCSLSSQKCPPSLPFSIRAAVCKHFHLRTPFTHLKCIEDYQSFCLCILHWYFHIKIETEKLPIFNTFALLIHLKIINSLQVSINNSLMKITLFFITKNCREISGPVLRFCRSL